MDFGSRNYDPALGRWMNIDPQSGRYMGISPFAAMGNNPVTFVDPNGEELVTALIAGAVIGAWLGGATTAVMGGDINDIGNAMLFGAISGLATAGIGEYFAGPKALLAGNPAAQGFAKAGVHGVFQGSLSAVQGGDFGTAFISGGLSSGVASGLSGQHDLVQLAGATAVSGITEALAGGNVGEGLVRGASIALLNHIMHKGAKFEGKDNPCPDCPITELREQALAIAAENGASPQAVYDYLVRESGLVKLEQSIVGGAGALEYISVGGVIKVAKGGKELFNFTKTTLKHMNNPGRKLPVSILDDAIKSTKGLPDPQGTKALMHYTQMTRNGKLYNLEVLYDKATNTILHFQYGRGAMGPLTAIPK